MIAQAVRHLIAALAALAVLTGCKDDNVFDAGKISSNLAVFTDGSVSLADRRLIEVSIGRLELPDGRLAATDPLVQPERPPFERMVKPGSYPVSFLRGAAEHERPALQVIRFSDAKVERFELAVIKGQDIGSLKGDEFFGIPVDAGVAGFANSAYGAAQAKRDAAEQQKPGSRYSNYYDDVLSNAMPGKTSDEFALDHPLDGDVGAAAITQAGWGDGYYPVFFGLDKDGEPALAFIDFFVITNGDGRNDIEKEQDTVAAKLSDSQKADNRAAYKALKDGDDTGFAALLREGRIGPKDFVLEHGESFLLHAIRLDRPAALRAMIDAGADDRLGPHDQILKKPYSEFARELAQYAEKAKAEGKSTPAPRSAELMAVISELAKRSGTPDSRK